MKELSALVADDEPLARRVLTESVGAVDWLACVGEAVDGGEALRSIDALRPDIVFLDVEMPVFNGLEVVARVRHKPAVVFTTAYDRYAVSAFELQALDYLLKPFTRERFVAAAERARRAIERAETAAAHERACAVAARDGALRNIFVRTRERIVPLPVREIVRLEAQDDYVVVHVAGGSHLVHLALAEFERRLDPERFLRVHRGHIVNLDHVASIEPGDGLRLVVRLRDGTSVTASRVRSRELRARRFGRV